MALPRHLAALLLEDPTPAAWRRALDTLDTLHARDELRPLAATLQREGVALIALDALARHATRTRHGETSSASSGATTLRELLNPARRRAAAIHLAQRVALTQATSALDGAAIPYVILKGAHLARVIYADPLQRVGVDVDVFVAPSDKARAIAALEGRGLRAEAKAETSTHELNFTDGRAWIDLHWHFLRPGRSRVPVEDDLIASRRRLDDISVPDDTWTTVIMLVHNAITDTVTARANRAVDLARWVRHRPLDWPRIIHVVEAMGLRAAAWATLTWVDELLGLDLDAATWRALRPPLLQRAYLRRWIHADPARLYRDHPQVVRLAFGLALHDRPRDALRFALRYLATAPDRRPRRSAR